MAKVIGVHVYTAARISDPCDFDKRKITKHSVRVSRNYVFLIGQGRSNMTYLNCIRGYTGTRKRQLSAYGFFSLFGNISNCFLSLFRRAYDFPLKVFVIPRRCPRRLFSVVLKTAARHPGGGERFRNGPNGNGVSFSRFRHVTLGDDAT